MKHYRISRSSAFFHSFFSQLVPSVSACFTFIFTDDGDCSVQCVVFIFYKTTETLVDMNNKNTISVFIKHDAKERKEYLHVYLSTPEPRISFIYFYFWSPSVPSCHSPCTVSVHLRQEGVRIGSTLRALVPPARQYLFVNYDLCLE